jgi:hypothetical protein
MRSGMREMRPADFRHTCLETFNNSKYGIDQPPQHLGRPAGSGRPELPVPRVFFQKICGFRAGISYSQSFFKKDLWFRSSTFRPTGPGPLVGISCSQRPPLYPDGQWLRTVAKYSTARFCRELKSQSPVIPYPTTCLPSPPFRRRIFDG